MDILKTYVPDIQDIISVASLRRLTDINFRRENVPRMS